ncbi:hypothetical protein GCM10010413_50790 [Promicromonospora sukumoe]
MPRRAPEGLRIRGWVRGGVEGAHAEVGRSGRGQANVRWISNNTFDESWCDRRRTKARSKDMS